MSSPTRVQPGVPSGGQFAATVHAEADVSLDAPLVEVRDASGELIGLEPGVIDDEALWVYRHGQCLALAATISHHTGWPVRVCSYIESDPDAEEPTGFRTNKLLRHAYVVTPTGDLLDIGGVTDPETAAQMEEGEDVIVEIVGADKVDGVLHEHAGYLEEQDLGVASHFVQAVLDLVE